MIASDRFEQVTIASAEALHQWLAANHERAEGVWLVTWKKADPDRYIPREAILDALVAHGWTDGLMRKLDDARVMQLISPRRQQRWAQTYKDRAARLIAEGRMQPPGLAAIERAKAAGLWDATADVDALLLPDDLAAALVQAAARARWDALAPSYRRNVLRWIAAARTPPTRSKRVAEAAASTAARRRIPQM